MDRTNRVSRLFRVMALMGVGYSAFVVGVVACRLAESIRQLAFWAVHLADKRLETAHEMLEQLYISKKNLKK